MVMVVVMIVVMMLIVRVKMVFQAAIGTIGKLGNDQTAAENNYDCNESEINGMIIVRILTRVDSL